jgi:hypothetical protein
VVSRERALQVCIEILLAPFATFTLCRTVCVYRLQSVDLLDSAAAKLVGSGKRE